jgi:hypothetical protein
VFGANGSPTVHGRFGFSFLNFDFSFLYFDFSLLSLRAFEVKLQLVKAFNV